MDLIFNKSSISCHNCKNQECLIKHCSSKWVSYISERKNLTLYKKTQHFIHEGSYVYGAYFIQSGSVKVVSANLLGKEQIVRLASNGHIVGHKGYNNETYPIGAIAIEDSSICFIDNDTLHEAFLENPKFTFEAMMFYSKELRKSEQRNKYLAQMTSEEKITFALLYLVEIFGINLKENAINVSFSRQEIANIVGTNADQVSRTLAVLKQKNTISTQGRKILLHDYASMKKSMSNYASAIY